MAEEFEAYDEEMVILLDNMPKGCITEAQKETLIEDAKRWGAHYLIYATEFDGVHYFHYGLWKDLRPRFGTPTFRYFDGKGTLCHAHYSINFHLTSILGLEITGLLSTDQYK